MNRTAGFATLVLLTGAGAAIVFFRGIAGDSVSARPEVSESAAASLQMKIDAVKRAVKGAGDPAAERSPETVEVSDVELESYLLHTLREDIPAKVETFDVMLLPGAVAADATLTFGAKATGNPSVDGLLEGTHALFLKGKLSGENGKGRFELQEVRVDGIPVPSVLVESLVSKYVKPRYPQIDIKEPFVMPWGIRTLSVASGKATVEY